jgi:tryptophanyl-tRNA synthetase
MKRMLSGIKPTGRVTLGNYIGAIKPFVQFQNEYEMIIFVANLHSMTIYQEPKDLRKNTKDLIALYIAAGLDPEQVTLFLQSDVLEHAQLGWYLGCMVSMGELSRMTQYKSKKLEAEEKGGHIGAGIFNYPSLMNADILMYDPDYVPVGEDQKQHVELARKRRIVKKTAYLMRGMSFLVLFVFYITKLILIININNNTHCEHI